VVLEQLESWPAVPGWGRVRDPLRYALSVFGEPQSRTWGWRFTGHHLSLHYTVVDGVLASATPSFIGVDPAEFPLPGGMMLRPCAALEDLGRELVRSLDSERLSVALLSQQAPPDLVTGNRSTLTDGMWVPNARELFRNAEQFPGSPVLYALEARHRADEDALDPAAVENLRWTHRPAGLSWSGMQPATREILTALLRAYLERLPDEIAQAELGKVDGDAAHDLHFAWAGSIEPRRPHSYRVQGPRLLLEYDNTQRDANHVHTVWRDPQGDFGSNVLAAHYATHH